MDEVKKFNSGSDIIKSFAKKYGLGAGLLILFVTAGLLLFYLPMSDRLSETNSELADWNNKLKEAIYSEEMVDKLAERVDQLKVEITEVEKRIYYLEDMPAIGRQLISYGHANGLRTTAMTPNYDELFKVDMIEGRAQLLKKLPLELKMVGRYAALGKYVSKVEKLPFIFSPEGFHLQADPEIYPNIEITVTGFLVLMSGDEVRIKTNEKRADKASKG